MAKSKLATKLSKSAKKAEQGAPHVVIEALAGTGKTTTLVEGLRELKGERSAFTPSPQQEAIWDAMKKGADEAKTINFVAFNRSIANELSARVPAGCEAMTMHSMGRSAVLDQFSDIWTTPYAKRNAVDGKRVRNLLCAELGITTSDLFNDTKYRQLLSPVEQLVSLVKMNLVDPSDPTAMANLIDHYLIELNGERPQILDLVPRIIERCKRIQDDKTMDFNDMIWLPVALDLPVRRYDLLLVDEAQDLNRCQQALAMKAGRRLILCGDPHQAIYGFAGADSQSMSHMEETLNGTDRGCVVLPLTVTRRCGKAIVEEARKIVPEFEAHESNPAGRISTAKYKGGKPAPTKPMSTAEENRRSGSYSYDQFVEDGDMVLCRVNAPLVQQCFRFIRNGRKANIQGRDIGQGLRRTVEKQKAKSIEDLIEKIQAWFDKETSKENAKKIPSEQRLITLEDNYLCLMCFTEDAATVEDVIANIDTVFSDEATNGIKFSSIHRAKGLESDRVFFLMPQEAPCPHPMAKTEWQKEQEYNLLFVAITRAINELVYVK